VSPSLAELGLGHSEFLQILLMFGGIEHLPFVALLEQDLLLLLPLLLQVETHPIKVRVLQNSRVSSIVLGHRQPPSRRVLQRIGEEIKCIETETWDEFQQIHPTL
jgi:hypothetical protein